MRQRRLRLIASLAMVAALLPAPVSAQSPPAPDLWIDDAPLTRNQTVMLHVIHGDYDAVDRRLVANSPSLAANGLLADGVDFPASGNWTLAAGTDGPRTIYAQVLYKDGTRRDLAPLPMHLLTDGPNSLYNDMDGGHGFVQGPWRQRQTSATRRFIGSAIRSSANGPAVGFRVLTGEWGALGFQFNRADGVALTAGTYAVNNSGGGAYASVQAHALSSLTCSTATGTVTIRAVEFHAGEDLARVDADYSLICGGSNRVAGTLQYGVERKIQALGQTVDRLAIPTTAVGQQSAPQSVIFTNIGDLPAPLGQAARQGTNASDFEIVTDGCSNTTLAVDGSCSISVRSTPTARGNRFATLAVPDQTVAGSRFIRLVGAGEQPTTLDLTASHLPPTPGQATFVVTISPPTAHLGPGLYIDGVQQYGPTVTELSSPARRSYTYNVSVSVGRHVATATFLGGDFFQPSEAAPIAFEVVPGPEPPSGSVTINGNSGYTASRNVTLSVPATHGAASLANVAISNNATNWTERPYALNQPWTLTAGDGLKTVYVKWRDTAGRWSEIASATIFLDTTAPSAGVDDIRVLVDRSIKKGKVPLLVAWRGDDGGSGIARYELQRRVGINDWITVSRTLTGGTIELALAPQKTHTFRVRAVDKLGHVGAWNVSRAVTLSRYQEGSTRVAYGGTWRKATDTSYWGGAVRHASRAGAIARIQFTGRQAAWVAWIGPSRGKAEVLVNGVVVATIDLDSRHVVARRVVWVGQWSTAVTRTITIRVLGTSGRPRVDLDAFVTSN